MNQPVILAAQRTPIGSFQGALAQIPAPKLGAIAIKAALKKSGLEGIDIDECYMGQVLSAGSGQAPARQAAVYAELPHSVKCITVNKVCGSGLQSVAFACDQIRLGQAQAVIAGGQENMTLSPHLLETVRSGYRLGHQTVSDSMLKDGLWDPFYNWHMGNAAELCVKEYKTNRQEQDEFAKTSYLRAQQAQKQGLFTKEICPVEILDKKSSTQVTIDEEPGKAKFDKMLELRPAFEKEGTITAANASKINDGAAALVLSSESLAQKKNLKPIAKVLAYASFAQDPKWFTTAPAGAMKKALEIAGLKIKDIDLFEINEAFSVVTMAAMKELEIPHNKVNVHGGAVALGHPLGASGARILTTLIHALEAQNKKYGMASLCIGGGEGIAMIIERLP